MKLSTTNGAFKSYYMLYYRGNPDGILAKANGLGDIELSGIEAPIEIGNRVWNDTDSDGIQDAGETGISGVSVSLCTGAGAPIATATTDGNGNYYFSSGTGTNTGSAIYGIAGLTANTAYQVKFPTTNAGKSITTTKAGSNSAIDSDAPTTGIVAFTTGTFGANNHTFDVGYGAATCSLTLTAAPTACVPATNAYSVTGTIGLSNNSAGGTATITDGTKSTTVAVAASATSVPYSLTGLTSGTGSHTVTVSLSGCGTDVTSYSAPTSCTVAAVCSLSAVATRSQCNTATNTYSTTVTVSLLNPVAGTLTVSLPGSSPLNLTIANNTTTATAVFNGRLSDGASYTAVASLPGCGSTAATYSAPGSCTMAAICSLTVTATPTACVPATNAYSVTGTIGLSNNSAGGTATITDGTKSTTVTVAASATSVPYSLTGLTSGTGSHTVTVSLSGCGTDVTSYSAPTSCTVAAVCSLSAVATRSQCNTATNTYSTTVTVSLLNPVAGTLTVSLPGSSPLSLTIANNTTTATAVFNGRLSDGASYTAVASLPGCGSTAATFTAPTACTQAAVIRVNSATVCAGATATLSASGCLGNVTWSTGASGTAITVATSATTTTQTVLSYTATCTLGNSTTTAVGTVTVSPLPSLSITASPSATATAGSSVSLTLSGCTGGSTAWSTGAADNNKMMIVATPITGANTYSAVCTTPSGCTASTSIVVTGIMPSSLVVTSASVCAGQTATLTALGCLGSVSWSGGTSPSTGTLVTVATSATITATATFSYTATCTPTVGAATTAVATVTFSPIPSLTLTASPSATVTAGNSVTITATGCAGGTVNWSTGVSGSMSAVVVGTLGSTVYSASCTTPTGCSGTASITVVGTAPLTAGLGDKVFEDLNANGIQDAGEPGINGVLVTLYNNGTTVTTTTANGGLYSFTGLTPGVSYTVGFGTPSGYTATLQNSGADDKNSDASPTTGLTKAYSLTANEFNPTVDAGFYKLASLGDKVFADNNGNGIQDLGIGGVDTAIGGVTVVLYINGVASATTTTASTGTGIGCYSFTGLTPGNSLSYSVGFSTPTGYTATGSNVGNDGTDSDPVNGITASITLSSGEYNPTLDAGFVLLPVARLTVTSATVCAGTTASLSASGCTGTVNWSAGTSPSSGTLVTVSTIALSGITSQTVLSYTATCTVGNSVTSAVATVTVNPLPSLTITASPSQTVTAGTAVQLTVTGCTGGIINWTGGTTNPNTGATVSVSPMVGPNSYTATCTTVSGCTGVASVMITGSQPSSLVVTSATVCAGEPASLMALGCNTGTVTWSAGTSPSSGTMVTVATAALSGITSQTVLSYTATCTNGSVSTAIGTVTVNPQPSLSITASDELVTVGGSVTLTASGCTGGTVNWSTGQQNVSSVVVMAAIAPGSTIYSATCVTTGGCSDSEAIEISTIAGACNLVVTAVPGPCEGTSRLYTVTGQVSATGSVGVTSVTVSSGTKTTVVSLSGNGPASYTLSSLVYVAGVNTAMVMSSASACGMSSVTYTAPVSCSTDPPGQPTFNITKVVNKSRAKLGDVLTYTVTLVNTSTVSGSVVATDVLDSKLGYVPNSATVSAGNYAPTTTGGTWTVASLAASATATLTFSASVLAEGIVYNTATIDSKTATVCTSIPVRVCAGSDYAFSLTVVAGQSRYQWYRNDVLVQDNDPGLTGPTAYTGTTPEIFMATSAGEYRVVINQGVTGKCPDGSCCPMIIEEVSLPTGLTLTAMAPTCVGSTPQANGKVVITGLGSSTANVGLTYQLSTGGMSFSASSASPVPAAVIPANGEIVTNAVGGITYFVRVYGPALPDGESCYVDLTVVVPVANCACPAEVCVPVTVKKTKVRATP